MYLHSQTKQNQSPDDIGLEERPLGLLNVHRYRGRCFFEQLRRRRFVLFVELWP